MAKKKKKTRIVAKKKTAPKIRINPKVALAKATTALTNARTAWAKAVFMAKNERPGAGCGGSCDGYGEGVGFDWVEGKCGPAAAHAFSAAAQKQAEDDVMSNANYSCTIPGGASCKCKGGTIKESRRTAEQVGESCMYTLFVKLDGGTCQ